MIEDALGDCDCRKRMTGDTIIYIRIGGDNNNDGLSESAAVRDWAGALEAASRIDVGKA